MKQITEEMKAEINSVLKPESNSEGITTEELILTLGWSKDKVMELLRELKRRGQLEVVRVYREDVDGNISQRPAYILHIN